MSGLFVKFSSSSICFLMTAFLMKKWLFNSGEIYSSCSYSGFGNGTCWIDFFLSRFFFFCGFHSSSKSFKSLFLNFIKLFSSIVFLAALINLAFHPFRCTPPSVVGLTMRKLAPVTCLSVLGVSGRIQAKSASSSSACLVGVKIRCTFSYIHLMESGFKFFATLRFIALTSTTFSWLLTILLRQTVANCREFCSSIW